MWFLLINCCVGETPPVSQERAFRSPQEVVERCVFGIRVPGGRYSATDDQLEKEYCSIDLHSPSVALCPKTWSTSPGTIVYSLASGPFQGNPAGFEREACAKGGSARRLAASQLAMFKMSMNELDTSGTYAPASLLYYHLSRYFHTEVSVPVAVWRSIEEAAHVRRVVEPGLRFTAGKAALRQIHAGWKHFADAAANPRSSPNVPEYVTPDQRHFYGVLLEETGTRYGTEVNGTRAGSWGVGHNQAFQKTAPFLALRVDKPLPDAIREGLRQARRDPALQRASDDPAEAQMVWWMRELTEIVLLDFLLGQQDRVGNIDYEERWYWVSNGTVQSRVAAGSRVPSDIAGFHPLRLRRTWINDNDAAVRTSYSDFAEKTHMLDGISHFSATTYRQLLALDQDLQENGGITRHLNAVYRMGSRELDLLKKRTREAATVLQTACRSGKLRFDLEPAEFLLKGGVQPVSVDCAHPRASN